MSTLSDRVADLELAVLALGEDFGDQPGHPFRGNQHSDGVGGRDDARNLDRVQKLLNYEKMHGTSKMLEQMTPAERAAHHEINQNPDVKTLKAKYTDDPADFQQVLDSWHAVGMTPSQMADRAAEMVQDLG